MLVGSVFKFLSPGPGFRQPGPAACLARAQCYGIRVPGQHQRFRTCPGVGARPPQRSVRVGRSAQSDRGGSQRSRLGRAHSLGGWGLRLAGATVWAGEPPGRRSGQTGEGVRRPRRLRRSGTVGHNLLGNKLEIQAEILNHRRYTVITERYCMTHSDTLRTAEFDGKELMRFLAAQFNIPFRILPLPLRSVHVVYVADYSNADD